MSPRWQSRNVPSCQVTWGVRVMLGLPVKRRRALLASNRAAALPYQHGLITWTCDRAEEAEGRAAEDNRSIRPPFCGDRVAFASRLAAVGMLHDYVPNLANFTKLQSPGAR